MPESGLDIVHVVWKDTKGKIIAGDYEHFIRISQSPVSHVRPHARDSENLMETTQGTMAKRKSFWLNASYIFENIVNKKAFYSFDSELPTGYKAGRMHQLFLEILVYPREFRC